MEENIYLQELEEGGVNVDDLLPRVRKPSRYTGNEFNAVHKDWQKASLRIALAFPDLYEIGMSHQGLQILYRIINQRSEYLADRVYAPDLDFEELLRQKKLPLFALESKRPLTDFDIIGITLPYELCYTNILTLLDLGGIALRAEARPENAPLVIGGGPGAFHPEPIAEFFDAILIGDGEEAIVEIADLVREGRAAGLLRAEILQRLSRVKGVYVPAFFEPIYDADDTLLEIRPLVADYPKVKRRILADLETYGDELPPLAPITRIVHERLALEIARGCTRGCRFCQAGMIYRPVRERSPERIMELAAKGLEQGGFDELALLSLSTGDYACIGDLLVRLMDTFVRQQVSVSMPSMRVGTLTPAIMEQIKRVRKTGFTLAPEAGTDRLRRVINKGITEEDLLAASRTAFDLGWKLLKFYFMFGLPTETEEDLAAIAELANKALREGNNKGRKINVSVATFVPKPHTPFQRQAQLSIAEGFARLDFLKKKLSGRNIQLKWNDPRQSFLEGVLSRGDRRLSRVIEAAWRLGARFDAWNEHFRLDNWQQAAETTGVPLDPYLRERGRDEILPWQHLDCGVDEEFMEAEFDRGLAEIYTPDCRVHGCQKCGLCDFKEVKPIVQKVPDDWPQPEQRQPLAVEAPGVNGPRFSYKLTYSRTGRARFLGHLELIQMFFRVLRMAGLPLNFSKGFNPTPKVSFSPALPLGTESLDEFLVIELSKPIANPQPVIEKLNAILPSGFKIMAIALSGHEQADKIETCYVVHLHRKLDPAMVEQLLAADCYPLEVVRKGRMKTIDARPMVVALKRAGDLDLELILASEPGCPGIKPIEIVKKVAGLSEEDCFFVKIRKLWSRDAKQA